MTIRNAGRKVLCALALLLTCAVARAGEITIYTALKEDDVRVYLAEFAKAKPGIKVNVLRLSTGDLIARILAERANPRHDVIWGTALTQMVDPRLLEMAEPYRPAGIDAVKTQFKDPANRWFATTGYFAGFCVNTEVLKKRNLPMPTSWQDLLNPVYKGQIVMPNAASSGTGYLQIVSLLQMKGEDKGWEYLKELDKNIGRYIKSGSRPCRMAASGEYAIGLSFAFSGVKQIMEGYPIAGHSLAAIPARERNFGIVFQSYSLFPNMTVARNIAYGLECRRWARDRVADRVASMLALVNLADQADKHPHQLSGGQQQRVALARALAPGPAVLLLDEPLSALDAKVREELRAEIKDLQTRLRITTIMVTHDQNEAMELADRIVVMNRGRIEQIGRAVELYERPATRFVAGFVGRMNVVRNVHGRRIAGIRPEHVRLLDPARAPADARAGCVERCVFLGSITRVTVRLDGEALTLELQGRRDDLAPGRTVVVRLPPGVLLPLDEPDA